MASGSVFTLFLLNELRHETELKLKIQINRKYALISALTVFLAVAVDFFTKRIVMASMSVGESIPLIKGFLHITFTTNDGAAFGWFDDARWFFMTVSVVMIFGLTALLMLWDDRNPLFYISTSMIIGGGIGNMIDRIAYGEVIDFIDFCGIWQYIFNGADSFVCVGVGLLIIYYITSEIKNAKKRSNGDSNE